MRKIRPLNPNCNAMWHDVCGGHTCFYCEEGVAATDYEQERPPHGNHYGRRPADWPRQRLHRPGATKYAPPRISKKPATTKENEELKEKVGKLYREIRTLQGKNKELRNERHEQHVKNARMEAELRTVSRESAEWLRTTERSEEKVARLQADLENMKGVVREKDHRLNDALAKLRSLEESLGSRARAKQTIAKHAPQGGGRSDQV